MTKFLVALGCVVLVAADAAAKVRVVSTVSDLGAIAREVVGAQGEVTVLAKAAQDPHFVDPRPSLMLDLNRADVLLLMGAELETGWLPTLVKGARNPKILPGQEGWVDASALVPLKDVPGGRVDRSMGDIHPTGNPHLTTDPANAVLVARGLAKALGRADHEHAAEYVANAERFAAAAKARIDSWRSALAPFAGSPVVTYHRSWSYFLAFAGLEAVATVEPKPGVPPNASHVAQLVTLMRARRVPLVLQESWYGSATSEVVADRAGAKLVVVPGMSRDGQAYLEHVGEVVDAVVTALAASRGGSGGATPK